MGAQTGSGGARAAPGSLKQGPTGSTLACNWCGEKWPRPPARTHRRRDHGKDAALGRVAARARRTRIATDGESALQRAAQEVPDVVLLDALMPGMDGFEVARRLKANAATAPIPIIFMTGLTEIENVVPAFAAGGADDARPSRPARKRCWRAWWRQWCRPSSSRCEKPSCSANSGRARPTATSATSPAASPATVKKHFMHFYVKLSIETRTATAGLAMRRLQR